MIPSEDIKAKVKKRIDGYEWWCVDVDRSGRGSEQTESTLLAAIAAHREEEHGERHP